MHKMCNKQIFTLVFFISAGLHAIPALDENLDHNHPKIMIEEEIRLLEKDFNGDPYKGESVLHWDSNQRKSVPWVPESDMIAICALAHYHLTSLPEAEFYTNNRPLMREKENLAVSQRVGEMARYHVSNFKGTNNQIANAGEIEAREVMELLKKNPLRKGRNFGHFFGEPFKKRMSQNMRDGKYGY